MLLVSVIILSVIHRGGHYAENPYAECHYAGCCYAECHVATKLTGYIVEFANAA